MDIYICLKNKEHQLALGEYFANYSSIYSVNLLNNLEEIFDSHGVYLIDTGLETKAHEKRENIVYLIDSDEKIIGKETIYRYEPANVILQRINEIFCLID